MIYIYDILLNFCDLDTIYDFYEWDVNDTIENIKRIKLIHVEKNVFNDFLYYNCMIDYNFLLKIYRTCEIYTTKKIKIIDYGILISDGERVLAIEFDSSGLPIYKSKLLLDEEDEIAILANNLEITNINYQRKNKVLENRFFTRSEIMVRKYLMAEITECYEKKRYEKLKFIYQEYFDDKDVSYHEMAEQLIHSMKNCIDVKHMDIYHLLRLSSKKKQV